MNKEEIFELVAKGELSVEAAMQQIAELQNKERNQEKPSYDLKVWGKTIEDYPLTEAQKALWVFYQMDPESYAYNVPCAFRVKGDLDVVKLRTTCNDIAKRHPILKGHIVLKNNMPFMRIEEAQETLVESIEIDKDQIEDVEALVLQEARASFDLENGPLFWVRLLLISDTEKILLFNFHHIIFDGISLSIFLSEFNDIYENVLNGKANSLERIEADYSEYANMQQEGLKNGGMEKDKQYWMNELRGELPCLEFVPKTKKAKYSKEGTNRDLIIEGELFKKLMEMVQKEDTTLFTIMLSAYNVLMYYFGYQEDIIIGIPVAGRPNHKFDKLIGYFVNLIMIRSNLSDNPTFADILKQVKMKTIKGFEHSNYPYALLCRDICQGTERDQIFEVSFQFQNWIMDMERKNLVCNDFELEAFNNIQQDGAIDFSIEVHQFHDKLRVYFKYNPEDYEEELVGSMVDTYYNILDSVTKNGEVRLWDIDLVSKSQETLLIEKFTGPLEEINREKTMIDFIDKNAELDPDKLAIVCMESSVTYGELKKKTDVLAQKLMDMGVKQHDFVGVYMQRSVECILAFLAIMKAGAAYIPIDPIFPPERVDYILEESESSLLLYNDNLIKNCNSNISSFEITEEAILLLEKEYEGKESLWEKPLIQGKDVAYVIYTSGSTGTPKGVLVNHAGLSNFTLSCLHVPEYQKEDYSFSVASISFDFTILEYYCPLVAGGTFEILPYHVSRDGTLFKEKLDEGKCNFLMCTPAAMQMLLISGWKNKSVKKILLAGEALNSALIEQVADECPIIWNGYGPTETTVVTTFSRVHRGEKITIGKPVENVNIYILNKNKKLMPLGVPGEIVIGGKGVGNGYLKRPELSAEKFIVNPFASEQESKMYCSGDLGTYQSDGSIYYGGRIDQQVKLNGFRIELEEIESHLKEIPEIAEAVVALRKDHKNKDYLQAFVIVEEEQELPQKEEIVGILKSTMPFYMIPSSILVLKDMPKNVSCKIDRKYLTTTSLEEIKENYEAKEYADREKNENAQVKSIVVSTKSNQKFEDVDTYLTSCMEADLTNMIAEVLSIDASDIQRDEAIAELGFDSLLFTSLTVKVREHFKIKLNIQAFIDYPTVEAFVRFVQSRNYQEMREMYQEKIDEWKMSSAEESEGGNVSVDSTDFDDTIEKMTVIRPKRKKTPMKVCASDIAVVGMSGMFAQSNDVQEFYENLLEGKQLFTEYPRNRGIKFPKQQDNQMYTGSYLEKVKKFDYEFFNIPRKEAEFMDPQERILLQMTWKALDEAGYSKDKIKSTNMGVYVGATDCEYDKVVRENIRRVDANVLYKLELNQLAERVAGRLGINGPSKVVQTGDSSSLSAVVEAINSLRLGNVDMAIAGGVNLNFDLDKYELLRLQGTLNMEECCNPFDKAAKGYLRGEGAGVVILKSLEAAIAEGDTIYAVIKEYGETGSGNQGYGTFSSENQVKSIVQAYKKSGVDISDVQYMETSGFCNANGDITELNSIQKAYQLLGGRKDHFVKLGCVKGNIGHLDGASGMASLIKVISSLKQDRIPPTVGITELTTYSNLDREVFSFTQEECEWTEAEARYAAVNGFGFTGNNIHMILQAYESEEDELCENEKQLTSFHEKDCWVQQDIYRQLESDKPLQLVQVRNSGLDETFTTFWYNLKQKGISSYLRQCDSDKLLYRNSCLDGNNVIHLLVTVPSTGKKVEVVSVGKGTPVVMLAGYGITAPQWIPQFAQFKRKYQMICIHQPGVGLSEPIEENSFDVIAKIYKEVLDILEVQGPVHVVASSWGAFVAQYFASMYPAEVKSMILAGCSGRQTMDFGEKVEDKLKRDFEISNAEDKVGILAISSCLTIVETEEKDIDTLAEAKKISTPTLIIYGEHDQVVSRERTEELYATISTAKLHIMKGAGHIPNVTHALKFNHLMSGFIEKYDKRK